jgi:hypothetical protein
LSISQRVVPDPRPVAARADDSARRRVLRVRSAAAGLLLLFFGVLAVGLMGDASCAEADVGDVAMGPLPDPSARLLEQDEASEYWTLFIELEGGRRITQRFLLTNVGPGEHTAVAVGHFVEPGREPYRYVNGRRRARWELSEDRLFMDIGASHLDLHRPQGMLLISKDDIEIRLTFDFARSDLAAAVPRDRLPAGYSVDFLAVGAQTRGTIRAPWMDQPLETTGRTWMAHTWTENAEAKVIERRIDLYAGQGPKTVYGLQLRDARGGSSHWFLGSDRTNPDIESIFNVEKSWTESSGPREASNSNPYPLPGSFRAGGANSGEITIGKEWLRYDPLTVIPNPFRWFIRRMTEPQEVWADARIDVTLWAASGAPSSLPTRPDATASPIESLIESPIESSSTASTTRSNSAADSVEDSVESRSTTDSAREIEKGSAVRSVTGVASITFMNPIERP